MDASDACRPSSCSGDGLCGLRRFARQSAPATRRHRSAVSISIPRSCRERVTSITSRALSPSDLADSFSPPPPPPFIDVAIGSLVRLVAPHVQQRSGRTRVLVQSGDLLGSQGAKFAGCRGADRSERILSPVLPWSTLTTKRPITVPEAGKKFTHMSLNTPAARQVVDTARDRQGGFRATARRSRSPGVPQLQSLVTGFELQYCTSFRMRTIAARQGWKTHTPSLDIGPTTRTFTESLTCPCRPGGGYAYRVERLPTRFALVCFSVPTRPICPDMEHSPPRRVDAVFAADPDRMRVKSC